MTLYRILGNRGRTTIPLELRKACGIHRNDLLSFTAQEDGSILIQREKVCDHCMNQQTEQTLLDLLQDLSPKDKTAALVYLTRTLIKEPGGD